MQIGILPWSRIIPAWPVTFDYSNALCFAQQFFGQNLVAILGSFEQFYLRMNFNLRWSRLKLLTNRRGPAPTTPYQI